MQVRGDDGDTASTVTAKIGNTEQFREDLDALIADQYADGTLESYNYLPVSEPWYRAAAPYIIGGVVLIALFFFPVEPRQRRTERYGKLHKGKRPLRHSDVADRHVPGRCRRGRGKKRNWRRLSIFCAIPNATAAWARKFRRACCSSVLRVPAKRFWRALLQEKPAYRSCPSPAPTLSSCMSASAQAASEICLSRQRRSLRDHLH